MRATLSAARSPSMPAIIFSARLSIDCAACALVALARILLAWSVRTLALFSAFIALALAALLVVLALGEVVVPAHVVDVDHGAVGVEVEDLVDRRLEQRVVVADDHEAAAVRLEEVAQPHDRVGVEVVGGLVEQHDLGAGEQDAGELDAAALATGEGADRLGEDALLDPEGRGHLRGLGLGGVPATGVELGVGARPALHAALVDLRVLVGHLDLGLTQAAYDVVEAARRQDPVAGDDLGVADPRVLREVADLAAADDLAVGRGALAGEDAGEGRLAGTVAPHEADLVACGDAEGDVLHEEPRAGSDLELLGGDHLGRHPTKGWRREPHRRRTRYCAQRSARPLIDLRKGNTHALQPQGRHQRRPGRRRGPRRRRRRRPDADPDPRRHPRRRRHRRPDHHHPVRRAHPVHRPRDGRRWRHEPAGPGTGRAGRHRHRGRALRQLQDGRRRQRPTPTAPARPWRFPRAVLGEDAARAGRHRVHPGATSTPSPARVNTGCGQAPPRSARSTARADQQIYLDTTFFADVLEGQLGGQGGDFVEPYVLGHEYGHHIQNLIGTMGQVRTQKGPDSDAVRLELQADCYAGMWTRDASDGDGILTDPRRGRHHRGARLGQGRRRRPDPAEVRPGRRPRGLDPRLVGAADGVVHHAATRRARSQACDTFSASQL